MLWARMVMLMVGVYVGGAARERLEGVAFFLFALWW